MDLMRAAVGLIPMILSLSVHEWAHAWSANRLGDDTAERMGRLTLNPLAHIDPIGTIALPILLTMKGLPAFGWARPVPIDPTRFRRGVTMGRGMAISASAGPIANLVLAGLATVLLGVVVRRQLGGLQPAPETLREQLALMASAINASPLLQLLFVGIELNVILAVFNLIPVPPLDGSRIAAWLMPRALQHHWLAVERFAPFFLIAIFFFGGRLIDGPVTAVGSALVRVAMTIVFGA